MDINELFDKATLDAILADAKDNGIDAEDVEKVLATLPNGGNTVPTRGATPEGELMSLVETDKDEMTDQIARATGVERGKTGTILMLAAPFILKYLLGSGSSSNQGGSLLSGLLGGGQTQQSGAGSLLGSLLGGGQQTQGMDMSSLLGSMLGGGQTQQSASSGGGLMDALFGLLGGK